MRLYRARRLSPPAWVHLNRVAHALPSEIITRARSEMGLGPLTGTWAWATSTLARELLNGSGGDVTIVDQMQRDCLVPMELALMHPGREHVLPRHVVILGVPRLHAHPSGRWHSEDEGNRGGSPSLSEEGSASSRPGAGDRWWNPDGHGLTAGPSSSCGTRLPGQPDDRGVIAESAVLVVQDSVDGGAEDHIRWDL